MPPRIVTARSMGLEFIPSKLTAMGPEESVVGHYSAGARAKNMAQGIARAKSFHADHKVRLGAAGIGYHYLITDDGVIICCRSTFHQGAHVLNKNRRRIGVNMPGTLNVPGMPGFRPPEIRDRPTVQQARTFDWLLNNAHTAAMPRLHRTDVKLAGLPRFGHKNLDATSCPGLFLGMYKQGGQPWVEPSGDDDIDLSPVELQPEDEELLAEAERTGVDHEADNKVFGPDDEERDAPGDPGEGELPEADPEFDEDLSDLLAELDAEQPTA
jgi:hypothetical protein